jgi:parallel beta-helix repeat protein
LRHYVYTFINKSTGDSITLRVKEEIFPEQFFELRTKKKLGIATAEEKEAFKLLWEELKEKTMYMPMEQVFEEVVLVMHVNETGWWIDPAEFNPSDTPVQDAIDNVSPGGTVIVHEGIYEEQLYIAKSLNLRAADGESPEIWAPEPEMLESYSYDYEMFPGMVMPYLTTPLIMVNGSSDDIGANIVGFVIDGSSVTPENSDYGITGILYYNADGVIEDNEIKNIWGVKEDEGEPPYPWNGNGVFALSESNIVIHRNNIHNYTGVESCGILIFGIGLVKNPAEAMVTENIVTGARSPESPDQMGISTYDAIVTVNDNIVSGHIYTEDMWYASGMSIIDTNLTAQGNTLIGGGILVNTGCGYPHSMVFIKNNTVDVSGVYEEECGPFAGVAITTYPPVFAAYDPSVTATVEDNQFIGGPGSGIVIGGIGAGGGVEPVGTVDATITRNIVSDWDYGIELLNCSNSTVYLNDFVDNTQSVVVNESENTYNSTTEFGYEYEGTEFTNYLGNYWSDYEGEDADGNGIGDTPYEISGDNPDSYPLMGGFENYSLVTHVYESESIQEAIDNASDGDTVIVHEGIYEEQLYIAKSIDLKAAEGESPEIQAPEPDGLESYAYYFEQFPGFARLYSITPIIMVNGSSDDVSVDISRFVINGSSVTPENSEYGICGIYYLNADGTIEDNEVKNIWGLKEEEGEPLSFNGNSIEVLLDSEVTVRGNNVHNYTGVESWGICAHGPGAKATVIENTVTGARSPEFPDQCGILVGMGATGMVNNNVVTGYVYSEGWPYASGIAFCEASGSAQGNTLIDNQVGIWAEIGGIRPNSTVTIVGNTVDASRVSEVTPSGIALSIFWPPYPTYEGEPSLTATVTGNRFIGGSGTGIVTGDTICWLPEHYPGYGTVNATITRNVVSDWDYGIELLESSNSVVYLNDFVDNTQNVFVSNSTNVYSSPEKIDYTYEGEEYTNYLGNYWSNDYEGSDTDEDGIGDTPYNITGDNPDYYPLMEGFRNYFRM